MGIQQLVSTHTYTAYNFAGGTLFTSPHKKFKIRGYSASLKPKHYKSSMRNSNGGGGILLVSDPNI